MVQDERFAVLINVVLDYCSVLLDKNSDIATTIQNDLRIIAHGYYLQSAQLQVDSPIVWKKALDCISTMTSNDETSAEGPSSLMSIYPLEQLIRIAKNKGNMNRVAELSLRLAESWLAEDKDAILFMERPVYKVFVPSIMYKSLLSWSLDQRATFAQQALLVASTIMTNETMMMVWLSMRIAVLREVSCIEQLAQTDYQNAKNRVIAGKTTVGTLDTYRSSARSSVLIKSDDTDEIDIAAKKLVGHVTQPFLSSSRSTTTTTTAENYHEKQALVMLLNYMQRLEDRARFLGLASMAKTNATTSQDAVQNAWTRLGSFALLILQNAECQEEVEARKAHYDKYLIDMNDSGTDLVISCLIYLVKVMWMTCGTVTTNSSLVKCQTFVQEMISSALAFVQEKKKTELKSPMAIQSIQTESSNMENVILDLECALASVSSLIALSRNDPIQPNGEGYHGLGNIKRQSQFGSAALQCYSAWSGFHQTPWSNTTLTEARIMIRLARETLSKAASEWGRTLTRLETMFLDIMEADAEGGDGGLGNIAKQKFASVEEQLVSLHVPDLDHLIKSHCSSGMARLTALTSLDEAERHARESLYEAEQIDSGSIPFLWTSGGSIEDAKSFHKSMSRQLVADTLIRASRLNDAESFLLVAVSDAPLDFEAAFALGAFRLRMMMMNPDQPGAEKAAQIQLLKAAKLNPTIASPFALLGLWYEDKGDETRAFGCYSKALLLDPVHPVAGRGIIRIKPFSDIQNQIDAAVNTISPSNGWAWSALGTKKAMIDSEDNLAAICFQEAIRCRDISDPQSLSLHFFFSKPKHSKGTGSELALVWSELGSCYRRLGKYTAAVRAFRAGYDASTENFPPGTLCSWAEAELELGLFDTAAEKFGIALQQSQHESDSEMVLIAAFGQGRALLAMARGDVQDGKAGAAYGRLTTAIDGIKTTLITSQGDKEVQSDFGCALKLIGDLYTFGACLPPAVFIDRDHDERKNSPVQLLRDQIAFISQGEAPYSAAQKSKTQLDHDDDALLKAAMKCDLGNNILIQSQILAKLHGEGQGSNLSLADVVCSSFEVRTSFDRAAKCFRAVVAEYPLYAPAWCGLGCAVCGSDPLLAQHAFARCLQLDKTSPEGWSNLGFLYASHGQLSASMEMMDQLTQVADTPLMWICRAALLERKALGHVKESYSTQQLSVSLAADAYRAALQVTKHPSALLGLSLSCRIVPIVTEDIKKQSFGFMREYEGLNSGCNQGAALLRQVLTIEDICQKEINQSLPWVEKVMQNEMKAIVSNVAVVDAAFSDGIGTPAFTESKNGFIDASLVQDITGYEESLMDLSTNLVSHDDPFDFKLSVSRHALNDPENGVYRLELAKQVARELYPVQGLTKRKLVRQNVEVAILASNKAVSVLMNQVISVHCRVDSEKVAEALVLLYWVGSAGHACLGNTDERPPVNTNTYDLQKAMMMCPDSKFAREAIREFNE